MVLSIIFSVAIYQATSGEMQKHLDHFQTNLKQSQSQNFISPLAETTTIRDREVQTTADNLSIELIYINLLILVVGGLGSYFLARRTLLPIEKAHEAESRFTSDASHELRTPLAVMRTEIEVALKDNNLTANELKDILSSNLEEVNKLSKLSEMLLSLSRLDNAKLNHSPVNLNKITANIVKDLSPSPKRISIINNRHLVIDGNETAITDLIKILVENALQYSPNDSQITINLSKCEHNAKFEITNTGPGIQTDKLPYIFERFYRADSSRTDGGHKGYGLGLALAKNIVEIHEGRLLVSSEPDKETTFTFLLPLYRDHQAKAKN
jgi:signal transduction histidine kinase